MNVNIEHIIVDFLNESKFNNRPLYEVVGAYIEENDIEPTEFLKNFDSDFIGRIRASYIECFPRIAHKTGDTIFKKVNIFSMFEGD